MTKRTKIILIICGIALVIAIVVLVMTSNTGNQKTETVIPMPTKVAIPTRPNKTFSSDTGAQYITPTDLDYNQIQLIKILRSKVPIINDGFSINFDYQTNKFTVKITDGSQTNLGIFKQWLTSSGYDQIPDLYWQIQ